MGDHRKAAQAQEVGAAVGLGVEPLPQPARRGTHQQPADPAAAARDDLSSQLLEGTIKELLDALREEISSTMRGKLGGLLIRPAARRLRTRLDPDTYGGAYLLGLRGLAVIAHGNSGRRAIANAIRLSARGVEHGVVERLAERLPVYDRRASEPAPT